MNSRRVDARSENIIQKIHLKPETTEAQFRAISNQIETWGKLLADGIDDDGYYVVIHFDDGLDFLAFLVAAGGAALQPVTAAGA